MAPTFEDFIQSHQFTFFVGQEGKSIVMHAAAIAATSQQLDDSQRASCQRQISVASVGLKLDRDLSRPIFCSASPGKGYGRCNFHFHRDRCEQPPLSTIRKIFFFSTPLTQGRLRRLTCVCVCVLLWPCTLWVWAVTMRQLCTFCYQTPAPVQKPTMRPADRISNTMLNIGNKEK